MYTKDTTQTISVEAGKFTGLVCLCWGLVHDRQMAIEEKPDLSPGGSNSEARHMCDANELRRYRASIDRIIHLLGGTGGERTTK